MSAPAFEDPRAVLARHGLRPKRGFSQNFLVSRHAVERIAEAAALSAGEAVLELGPGLGTLTAALLRVGARVIAFERDRDMLRVLNAEFGSYALELREADVAELDYAALARELGTPPCVVGNLPYAITGAILRNLTAQRTSIARALVMVQREVGERLLAAPGSAAFGALTVFASAAFEIANVLRVPAGAFFPPPKVQSVVLRLTPRAEPLALEDDAFRAVVHAAFQQRRKTLRNALIAAFAVDAVDAALEANGIDPVRRGETLSVVEFARLAQAFRAAED
jgi:16S rRNA (adenine1518-N6/adenine1519-N6)-dimethyltransferase